MTEPNPLDGIGPHFPFEVTPGVFLVSRGGKRINIDWAMRKADIDALNAIASILNAAPAQAEELNSLRSYPEALSNCLRENAAQAAEIERLKADLDECVKRLTGQVMQYAKEADQLQDDNAKLRSALHGVQMLISEAAMTGFNCHDGNWAERLFESQQVTRRALTETEPRT